MVKKGVERIYFKIYVNDDTFRPMVACVDILSDFNINF